MSEKLVIIPARGGSKRIHKKNIQLFCGKPIIAYSIEAALQSGIFTHVMVSTDDEEIAAISRQYGAEVPFMRSAETANDTATIRMVYDEVLAEYRKMGIEFEIMCCILPTAPFVTAQKLRDAYQMMENDNQIVGVTPMVKYSYPPQRGYYIRDGKKVPLHPELRQVRSQDIEPIYHDAGQFYFHRMSAYENMISDYNAEPIVFSETEVQDIDDMDDWRIAELKYRLMTRTFSDAE